MSNQEDAATRELARSRNWSLIVGRVALVWAFVEAAAAGMANMSGGSLLGVSEQHFASMRSSPRSSGSDSSSMARYVAWPEAVRCYSAKNVSKMSLF